MLKRVTSLVPRTEVTTKHWPHLEGLTLADPHFGTLGRIDCILSSEVCAAVLLQGIRKGDPGTPIALQSVFGWVLLGAASNQAIDRERRTTSLHLTVDQELTKAITRFLETEEVPDSTRLSPQEEECYAHFRSTHSRDKDGRFIVRLPFRLLPLALDTFVIAAACFSRLEGRLARKMYLYTAYRAFMDEYLQLGHMEIVPPAEKESTFRSYLPHHPVIKQDGSGKIRVVYNASQLDINGVCFNFFLHTGPKLQEDIVIILIRWSFFQVVFTCDIVKMFRQFRLHPDDTDWQRIFWRSDTESPVETYRLTTVTYGTACAPFLANACLLQLANDEQERYPKGAELIRKSRYVDDFFAGGDTLEEAMQVREQLIQTLATAALDVGKWAANRSELLTEAGIHESAAKETLLTEGETVSTLGIRWCPAEDAFRFRIVPTSSDKKITKREMLAEISRLFDPVGWLSPVIIKAKIMLQSLWMQGAGWDDPVSPELKKAWMTFRDQLVDVEKIRVPRWFGVVSVEQWQLHCFCDASERAYAAAIYLVHEAGERSTSRLIAAKSKVAPIKVISLPKLELCGAVLLARLITYIMPKLDSQPTQMFCWSDSKVVLSWLQGHPSRWKTFIANRVSEISSSLPTAVWKHVRSADNPADLATRGETPESLRESSLWWTGPSWLRKKETEWPSAVGAEFTTDIEAKKSGDCLGFSAVRQLDFAEWCLSFSSVDKIVRILAYIHRWRTNAKLARAERRRAWLSAAELAWGRRTLLKNVQQEVFGQEIESLTSKNTVSNSSCLRRLLPFIDQEGILRVGERLQNSYLSEAEKHPIILPSKHHVTGLLVWKAHLSSLHGGPSLVQSQLSRQYWILRGRNFVRGVVRKCVKCARHRAATQTQQMAPLPAVRTRPARPFSFTGVDYAGPFWIKASPGRGQKSYKGYVAVFVCMVIKAVHLEVVSDYTSTAFLAAFRRFVARRGLCKVLYSDNGTTFRGADTELRRLFDATSSLSQQVAAEVAKDGVEWTYIPPRTPNFGGLWEANVKGFKHHLHRIIGETKMTFEEWTTVTAQIEACLNSRPLSPLSSSGDDVAALTPGHFLIGAPLVSPPEPFVEINETNSVCSRWHLLSLMRNHFWSRWRQEFLVQLQQRAKWLQPNYNFNVGDLVLFKDELTPPTKWPLARITRLFPGPDGLSRVAAIRTATAEYKRPISKLILLPVNSEAAAGLDDATRSTAGGSTESG